MMEGLVRFKPSASCKLPHFRWYKNSGSSVAPLCNLFQKPAHSFLNLRQLCLEEVIDFLNWNFHFGRPAARSTHPFVSQQTLPFSVSCPDCPSGSQLPLRGPENTLPRLLAMFFSDTAACRGSLGIDFSAATVCFSTRLAPAALRFCPAWLQTTAPSDDSPPKASSNIDGTLPLFSKFPSRPVSTKPPTPGCLTAEISKGRTPIPPRRCTSSQVARRRGLKKRLWALRNRTLQPTGPTDLLCRPGPPSF